jgi:outer membrane protein OmpA-like peptidoglycan-associated protein
MAGNSESNDASDIFWPGYVDAISNLAINLLFVIAVMCIVILSFVLEETTKGKPQVGDAPQVSQSTSESSSTVSAEDMKALQKENAKLKQELKTLQSTSASASSNTSSSAIATVSAAGAPQRSDVTNTTAKMDVVNARQEVMKDEKGQSSMSAVGAGLIVNFDPKVVTLSPEEGKEVMSRLEAYGSPKSTRWQITVVTPKGFSESARLGYYRAVAVRNVLIQNGVPGELINMRVIESAQAAADSARVTVNPAP